MSDRKNSTDQENNDYFQIEEVSTYSINNNILYCKQYKRYFSQSNFSIAKTTDLKIIKSNYTSTYFWKW
ncbi:12567_t:CDS:2 [Funneliformis caledonium]|uniref:12567_t:CDS:1 n=1 Tax=Funneliformis caledonium TaxID=1117310 RepID=A0A9N9F327_9GLOM|nr:12567_t:CDS:2 [Funneliformis caledonium]